MQKTSRTGYFPKTDLATTIGPWIGLVQSIPSIQLRRLGTTGVNAPLQDVNSKHFSKGCVPDRNDIAKRGA